MKNRPKKAIEAALIGKGFVARPGDHNYFIYHTLAGQKTLVKTKTSLGNAPKVISGDLLHAMARQCRLTSQDFLDLVDCPLHRAAYEEKLRSQGLA